MHQFSNKKRLQKSLFSLIIIAFSTVNAFAQFGQETVEARVKVIRQKFKIANAATNYEVITVDTCRFFLQNDTIKKMVKRVGEDELYEFYVDYKKEQYQPYFIFHQYKMEGKTWQNRYYFHEGSLIKWIDKDKEVVDAESVKFYCKNIDINGVFQQAMIDWQNEQLEITPEMFAKKEQIDEQVEAIELLLKDTSLYKKVLIDEYQEEGSPQSKTHAFYAKNGEKIAEKTVYTDSHTGELTDVYFSNNQRIFKNYNVGSWRFFNYEGLQGTTDDYSERQTYFDKGELLFCIKSSGQSISFYKEDSYYDVNLQLEYSLKNCY